MPELEPLSFDRVLAGVAREFERRARTGEPLQDALPAILADDEVLLWLRELGEKDPLAPSLEAWLLRLREEATFDPQRRELARRHHGERYLQDEPETAWLSLAELREFAFSRPAQRAAYLRGYFANSNQVADGVRRLWEERQRFAEGLGAQLASFEVVSPALTLVATRVLEATREPFASLGIRDPAALMTTALAEGAREGWPARLTERTTFELLGERGLFSGLRTRPFKLPKARGAASFMLALSRLGRALSRAASAASRSPFVLAADVFDFREQALGALFMLLPLSAAFGERRLGIRSNKARDQLRLLSRAVLVEVRVAAYRVLLRDLLLQGSQRVASAIEELSVSALGFELPLGAAGVFVRVRARDSQRLAGLLSASARNEALVEVHDEDWFRNPRAIGELRAELDQKSLSPGGAEAWLDGLRALQSRLFELL